MQKTMFPKPKTFKPVVIVGVITFILSSIVYESKFSNVSCGDKWQSLSIGIQGACSSHGGVKDHNGFLGGICILTLTGFAIWLFWPRP